VDDRQCLAPDICYKYRAELILKNTYGSHNKIRKAPLLLAFIIAVVTIHITSET